MSSQLHDPPRSTHAEETERDNHFRGGWVSPTSSHDATDKSNMMTLL
jgi:hypothetical protein